MNLRTQLLTVSDLYCTAAGVSRSRVSTIVLSGGRRLDRIEGGGDVSTATFERAMQWFSDNWPEAADWPSGVSRPARSRVPEAAE